MAATKTKSAKKVSEAQQDRIANRGIAETWDSKTEIGLRLVATMLDLSADITAEEMKDPDIDAYGCGDLRAIVHGAPALRDRIDCGGQYLTENLSLAERFELLKGDIERYLATK